MSNEFQSAQSQNIEPAVPLEAPQTPQTAHGAAQPSGYYAQPAAEAQVPQEAPAESILERGPVWYTPADEGQQTYADPEPAPQEQSDAPPYYAEPQAYSEVQYADPQAYAEPAYAQSAPVYYVDHEGNPVYYQQPYEEVQPYQAHEYPAPNIIPFIDTTRGKFPAPGDVLAGFTRPLGIITRPLTALWRSPYLWASLPPFALLALTLALGHAPLPGAVGPQLAGRHGNRVAYSPSSPSDLIVPASETFIVARQAEGNRVLLHGVAEQPLGRTLLAGSSGQVARVAVKPGQLVQGGQEIVALSTRAVSESAPPLPAERRDYGAENAQIAAVRAQRTWQDKVQSAHQRLVDAQNRVQAAQDRVARARDLVSRLQKGEAVEAAAVTTPAPPPRRVRPAASAARDAAMRESRRLQAAADNDALKVAAARKAALLAEQNAQSKQKLAQDAQSTADNLEVTKPDSTPPADADGKETSKPRDDGSMARKRMAQVHADSLKSAAADAADRAASLRREASRLSSRANTSQNKANDAARRAADMINLKVFENEDTAPVPAPRLAQNGDKPTISVEEAVRIAREAMEESRSAVADAERVRNEVKGYERPVENTRERFDSATRRLNAAQDQMWRNVPSGGGGANITPVNTPDTGVVLWVADLTREVRAGDPLAAVGRTDRLEVVLKDSSSAWKSLKPGSKVMTLVQNEMDSYGEGGMARPTALSSGAGRPMNGMPTMARVLNIVPPRRPGAPAFLRVAIHNPRRPGMSANNQDYGLIGRVFEPGTPVVCSLVERGDKNQQVVTIPTAAIRMDPQKKDRYVAVLAPVDSAGQDVNANLCRVEWRQVTLGRGDGVQNIVLSGLEPGERIALRPDAMENFTLAHGTQATLRVEQA